ncbi:MAG: ribosomal subunit interface protein [Bacteroidetes bacterium 4572_77]|nr:MAG: ribosomal subunit interface protein [Bacteroidetes bacterium 4572_77]
MRVDIQSVNFDADKKLENRISAKVSKLTTFFDDINDASINLHLNRSTTKENKVAEVKILVKGSEMFSKKQSNSFEESFDQAYEAIKTQLIKYKEKVRD